jgi:hypothetical protein
VALIEEPVRGSTIPPDCWPGTCSDRLEHSARAIEWQLAEPARLDGDHVLARHIGGLRERALGQANALPDETKEAPGSLVVG